MEKDKDMPKHVAIIMDGNGRWAKSKGLPRIMGHKAGAKSVKSIIESCINLEIPYLTLYVFSLENWDRPQKEVSYLMELLHYYLNSELENMHKNQVSLRIIGQTQLLHQNIQKEIEHATNLTKDNKKLILTIALSYSGRAEIVMAAKKIAEQIHDKKLEIDDINEDFFAKQLYTHDVPDPDLLIRSSGEKRLSNFLLWQLAYTELFFTNILWPDFGPDNFLEAINDFKARERRYGKTRE